MYRGDDTACAIGICPESGACCFLDDTCEIIFEELCLTAGGSYLADGAICNIDCSRGACCLPDGSCFFVSPKICDALSGAYEGDGTSCDEVDCPYLLA